MVDLPKVPRRFVTSEDVNDRVTPAAVAAPYTMFSRVLGQVAQTVDQIGGEQGAKDGARAEVTLDKDGQPVVTPPSMMGSLGSYGRAYDAASIKGFGAALSNDIDIEGAQIHQKFIGDPVGFNREWTAFADKTLSKLPDGSPEHALAKQALAQNGAQHTANIYGEQGRLTTANAKDSLNARIQRLDGELSMLARQGGTNSPEFHSKAEELNEVYRDLSANPVFGEPPEKTKLAFDQATARYRGDAILGQAEKLMGDGNYQGVLKLADQIDKIPNLSDAERTTLSNGVRRYAREQQAQIRQERTGLRMEADTVVKGIDNGDIKPDDLRVQDLIERSRTNGDFATMSTLAAKRDSKAFVDTLARLPAGERQAAWEQWRAARGVEGGLPGGAATAAPGAVPTIGGDLSPALQQIEQRRGLPAGYLGRTAQIESGGNARAVSKTGAKGVFQFTDGTRKSYPHDPFDPQQSAEAAGALAEDNARSLRTALGREPTAAELYLAHQQGAQGAAKLLANPGAPAASIVGTKAVIVNGGRQDMTAGEFASMWLNKFNGSKAPTTLVTRGGDPAAAAQSQQTINYAIKGYQTLAREELGRQWAGAKEAFTKGFMPDNDSLVALTQNIAIAGDKDKAKELTDWVQNVSAAGQMNSLTASQLEPLIASMNEHAQEGGLTAAGSFLMDRANDELKQRTELADKDPIGLSERNQVVKPVAPIDWTNSQGTLEGQLRARGLTAAAAADFAERPAISILKPAEKQTMTSFLQLAPADQVLNVLGAMGRTLPADTLGETMRDLGGNANARPYTIAASFAAQGQTETARAIVVGQRVLAAKPELRPKPDEVAVVMPDVLPPGTFAAALTDPGATGKPGPMQDTLDTATAIYAAKKGVEGSKDFDEGLWKASVEEAVGGFVQKTGAGDRALGPRGVGFSGSSTGDGQRVIAPVPGMSQAEFEGKLSGIPDTTFARMDDGQGNPLTRADFMDLTKMEAIGSGQYLLKLGRGYVLDRNAVGKPFVLDLR